MIIDCPNCNKKFQIDENLISNDGRLLQCGSCDHKWFFKLKPVDIKIEKKTYEETNINTNLNIDVEIPKKEKIDKEKVNFKNKYDDVINKKKTNYFNILIVAIISIIAIILIIDTFKYQLILLFPNVEFFLNNLYETMKDIKVFIIDLIK
tara:strand:+ start:721 stop:1170 length:450 start_codon:yes stop_codon:yes gene_type:complete